MLLRWSCYSCITSEAGIRNFTIADYWAARTERLLATASLVAEIGRAGQPAPGSLHNALDDADSLDLPGHRETSVR